jgi:hypothetical protein
VSSSTTAVLHLLAFLALSGGSVPAQSVAVVTTRGDEVGKRLNQWFLEGTAAGLAAIT